MSTLHPLGTMLALALALAGCQDAYADTGRDPRPGYPPGAASGASTAAPLREEPRASDAGTPWAPAFDVPFVEGTSNAPSAEEWTAAPVAREARVTQPDCEVRRVREWYRVDCERGRGIELITGAREGVSFGCKRREAGDTICSDSWVVLQARRGDRRALEIFAWVKWGPSPDAILTEQFLEGDPGPQVSVQGLRWGF